MDEKVMNSICNALALTTIMGNFPGLTEEMRKADKIEVEKQKLIRLVGQTKGFEIYEKIKNEAYSQYSDNGSFIFYELVKINSKLQDQSN